MTDPRETKRKILARRARFVAAAIATAGIAACGGEVDDPPTGDAGLDAADAATPATDTRPDPCLGAPYPDAEPCLEAPFDAEPDTGPVPCLDPIPDAGFGD